MRKSKKKKSKNIKDYYAKFKDLKDCERCYRLMTLLGEATFNNYNYGMGYDEEKKILWIRIDKQNKKEKDK